MTYLDYSDLVRGEIYRADYNESVYIFRASEGGHSCSNIGYTEEKYFHQSGNFNMPDILFSDPTIEDIAAFTLSEEAQKYVIPDEFDINRFNRNPKRRHDI
jgi:hypothetical protein